MTATRRALRWARGLWAEMGAVGLTDWAAALTYYGMLSLAPALVVAVALIGLLGGASGLLDQLTTFAPGAARNVVEGIIDEVRRADTGSSVLLLLTGLAAALWSASGYVAAYGRASFAIRRDGLRQSGWRQLISRVVTMLLMFVLLFVITAMVVISGPLAERAATLVGLGDSFPKLWSLAKWPVILAAMAMVVALLDSSAGHVGRGRGIRLWSRGAAVSIALWVPSSLVFSFYVSRSDSYSRVYGSLAGVVIFLVWLWLSNVALLVGVLANARHDRRRATVVVR